MRGRPGDLGADGGAGDALREQHGHHGHHHGRVPLPQGPQPRRPDRGPAARRWGTDCRWTPSTTTPLPELLPPRDPLPALPRALSLSACGGVKGKARRGFGAFRGPNAVSDHSGACCFDRAAPHSVWAGWPGIRRWPREYLPSIFDESRVDRVMEISQREAEETMRSLARVEGAHWPPVWKLTRCRSCATGGKKEAPLPPADTCFEPMHCYMATCHPLEPYCDKHVVVVSLCNDHCTACSDTHVKVFSCTKALFSLPPG